MGTGEEGGLHERRRLSFGEVAERYDRARPSYPMALIDQLVEWVGPDARVVDVGCGTAKGTRLLAARGMTGVAVEADPAMAAVAHRHLDEYPGWRVDVSEFESWRPQEGDVPVDLVASAQAWHWVDPQVGFRRAEEILRPGGWLAAWWNVPSDDQPPLAAKIDAVYREIVPELDFVPLTGQPPGFRSHNRVPDDRAFSPPVETHYPWEQSYSTEELLDLLPTHSNHRVLPPETLTRLLDAVAEVVEGAGGTFEGRYVCRLWAARREASRER